MTRLLTAALLTLAALPGCGGGCGGGQTGTSTTDTGVATELPPMSVGTIQAMGPHVFTATVEQEAPEGASAPARDDRMELVWQDTRHYRMSTWALGVLDIDEYREGDLLVYRRAKTPFRWGRTSIAPDALGKTITLFDHTLSPFRSALQVMEVDSAPEDPADTRRLELSLAERPTGTDLEEAARGHSALPLTLVGAVLLDEFDNRVLAEFEGTYRRRDGPLFDEVATTITYSSSRIVHPDGVALQAPPEAAPMLLERKAEEAARVDTSENGPIP